MGSTRQLWKLMVGVFWSSGSVRSAEILLARLNGLSSFLDQQDPRLGRVC